MEQKLEFPIYEFRPDKIDGAKNLLRYNGGNWINDDGEYDLAFISKERGFTFYVQVPYQKNQAWSWCKNMIWTAFVNKHPRGNAWHYMSKDGGNDVWGNWDRNNHPNEIAAREASNKCCEIFSYANGRSVEFNVSNETINSGLLRIVDTKEIIKPPKIFKCCYYGNHDWREEEKSK